MVRFILFELVLWPTMIFALLRGGRSERAAILILVIAFTATPFAVSNLWSPYGRFESGVMMISCASFVSLFVVALRSDKFWPLWLVAIQGQVVLAHIAPLLGPNVNQWVYQTANARWGFVQLFLIAVATWEHDRYCRAKLAAGTSARSSRWWRR